MEWMPMAMMPAVAPGPAAATKMMASTSSGKVRTATRKALPGMAQRVPPSRLPDAKNDMGNASRAPSVVPMTAMKKVVTMEPHARLKTSVAGFTRPRIKGRKLRSMPVMKRDQLVSSMVASARTKRPTNSPAPARSSTRLRRTCAGARGISVTCGVLTIRALDELRACPHAEAVDDEDDDEDHGDQRPDARVIPEAEVGVEELADAASAHQADDHGCAHVDLEHVEHVRHHGGRHLGHHGEQDGAVAASPRGAQRLQRTGVDGLHRLGSQLGQHADAEEGQRHHPRQAAQAEDGHE